jgi:hypothetical protein
MSCGVGCLLLLLLVTVVATAPALLLLLLLLLLGCRRLQRSCRQEKPAAG